jgi:hypothetical protein
MYPFIRELAHITVEWRSGHEVPRRGWLATRGGRERNHTTDAVSSIQEGHLMPQDGSRAQEPGVSGADDEGTGDSGADDDDSRDGYYDAPGPEDGPDFSFEMVTHGSSEQQPENCLAGTASAVSGSCNSTQIGINTPAQPATLSEVQTSHSPINAYTRQLCGLRNTLLNVAIVELTKYLSVKRMAPLVCAYCCVVHLMSTSCAGTDIHLLTLSCLDARKCISVRVTSCSQIYACDLHPR